MYTIQRPYLLVGLLGMMVCQLLDMRIGQVARHDGLSVTRYLHVPDNILSTQNREYLYIHIFSIINVEEIYTP